MFLKFLDDMDRFANRSQDERQALPSGSRFTVPVARLGGEPEDNWRRANCVVNNEEAVRPDGTKVPASSPTWRNLQVHGGAGRDVIATVFKGLSTA